MISPGPELATPAIASTILERLAALEAVEQVRILYACESGSRAWGFASSNSDYDVRFLYVRPRDWYLRIDLKSLRDVIERPVDGVFDINGWDLRKGLQLMRKSNPPLFEWLHSPIVYRATPGFREALLALAPVYYSLPGCAWHYLHMARGNYRQYLQGETIRLKKYLYVLRPLLAVRWLESGRGVVPMQFQELLATLIPPGALRTVIEELLLAKQSQAELASGPPIPLLSDWITAELERLAAGPVMPHSPPTTDVQPLNTLFLDWVTNPRVWSAT